jgi:hypothetical protein
VDWWIQLPGRSNEPISKTRILRSAVIYSVCHPYAQCTYRKKAVFEILLKNKLFTLLGKETKWNRHYRNQWNFRIELHCYNTLSTDALWLLKEPKTQHDSVPRQHQMQQSRSWPSKNSKQKQ